MENLNRLTALAKNQIGKVYDIQITPQQTIPMLGKSIATHEEERTDYNIENVKKIKKESSYPLTQVVAMSSKKPESNSITTGSAGMPANQMVIPMKIPSINLSPPERPKDSSAGHGDMSGNPKLEVAFRLVFLYQPEYFSKFKAEQSELTQNFYWKDDHVEYKIERMNYAFLPDNLVERISREHATISGYRRDKIQNETIKEKNSGKGEREPLLIKNVNDPPHGDSERLHTLAVGKDAESDTKREGKSRMEGFFTIHDESPNKTYILSDHDLGIVSGPTVRIKGNYKSLSAGEKMELHHKDIVAIRINLSTRELQFGFQFLCENL